MQEAERQFIRMTSVQKLTGLKRTLISNMSDRGEFPKPIKLSSRAMAWDRSEVLNWMEERIQERDIEAEIFAVASA